METYHVPYIHRSTAFFEELVARIQRIEPMAAPVYEANVFIKGVRRFDVRLHGRGDA